jgi:hypothetical protein
MTTNKTMALKIPATSVADAAVVEYDVQSGEAFLDGASIGYAWKGTTSVFVAAAGHRGRIGNSSELADWRALTPAEKLLPQHEQHPFTGDTFRAYARKNSRKAALAYLLARAAGVGSSDARYFTWAA